MALKLLAVGDIHLGRQPSRLPEDLVTRARDLGPAEAWRRTVDLAVDEKVEAVVLAGDVVEREEDFYEGFRELYAGVSRLAAAGIRVLGVAGNHDFRVLPRLAAQIKDFELLGRDGDWKATEVTAGGETVTLWGWSFLHRQVRESPLKDVRLEPHGGVNLGVLHCDRDQAGSTYAPVSSSEMAAAGLDGWLLGHVHAPDDLQIDALSGYLGSVTGTDPGEPGAHGPWLVTIERGRVHGLEQWVLAPLRWERIEVDLSGASEAEDARALLLEQVRALDATVSGALRMPDAAGLRVELVGSCAFGSEARELLDDPNDSQVLSGEHGTYYFIERVRAGTRPVTDLAELAKQTDPPGLLARRLILLDEPDSDPRRGALLQEARARLEPRCRDPRWRLLKDEPLDDEATAELLRRSGLRVLEQMLAQREDAR
jgi:DNA repair protein SbcD/Mre11